MTTALSSYLTVGEAARRLNLPPQIISDALYRQVLSPERCPIIGGRRMIPADVLPDLQVAIAARTRRAGEVGSEQ